jgi:hypothetical protein
MAARTVGTSLCLTQPVVVSLIRRRQRTVHLIKRQIYGTVVPSSTGNVSSYAGSITKGVRSGISDPHGTFRRRDPYVDISPSARALRVAYRPKVKSAPGIKSGDSQQVVCCRRVIVPELHSVSRKRAPISINGGVQYVGVATPYRTATDRYVGAYQYNVPLIELSVSSVSSMLLHHHGATVWYPG